MTIETVKLQEGSYLVNGNLSVPNDPANGHYQMILDWINEGNTPTGADIIAPDYVALRTGPDGYASTGDQLGMIADGTQAAHVAAVKAEFPKSITGGTTLAAVPAEILTAAADKLFASQLASYNTAVSRLAMYVVADGRVELTEMQATGEQVFNEETMEMDNVMASVITQSAIEAVEPTVEVTTYGDDPEVAATVSTITNPLITTDVAEREAAQATIDATPQAVKDA